MYVLSMYVLSMYVLSMYVPGAYEYGQVGSIGQTYYLIHSALH
jgi:hypothetical protein